MRTFIATAAFALVTALTLSTAIPADVALARGGGNEKCQDSPKQPGSHGTFTSCPEKGNPHNTIIGKGSKQATGKNPHSGCDAFNKGQEKKCPPPRK